MTDETKTCPVKMANSQLCGEPATSPATGDGTCILHTGYEHKDRKLFQSELDKILKGSDGDCYDFTRVVFPADGWSFPKEVDKDVNFNKTRFLGPANFSLTHFCGIADFEYAVFLGKVAFRNSFFDKEAVFRGATFEAEADFSNGMYVESPSFNEAKFKECALFKGAAFKDKAFFSFTEFHKTAFFPNALFEQGCVFRGARFNGRTDFDEAHFNHGASFTYSEFGDDTSFVRCTFDGIAQFQRIRLTDRAHVTFDALDSHGKNSAMFREEADFRSIRMDLGTELLFRNVNLQKSCFLGSRVDRMEFIDVLWPIRERFPRRILSRSGGLYRWLQSRDLLERKAVYDELVAYETDRTRVSNSDEVDDNDLSQKPLVAQLYRQLQANYIDHYRYREAGDFYVGEQEMMRQTERNSVFRLPSYLYQGVAYFGQSYLLPFGWLLLTLAITPMYLLCDGIKLPGHSKEINYDWSWSFSDLLFLKADYWNAVGANLSLATFNRGAIGAYLEEPYKHGIVTLESAVLIVLVSFLVLALRRAFKRKSF